MSEDAHLRRLCDDPAASAAYEPPATLPPMLDLTAALDQLHDAVRPIDRVERCDLTAAVGRVLAETAQADQPSPPFDKAMMDGFALRVVDHPSAGTSLPIAGEQAAGPGEAITLPERAAVRIMTGAPVPAAADAVIPVEQTTATNDIVTFNDPPPRPCANILRTGSVTAAGDPLVQAGTRIEPRHLAVLAEFGHATLPVRPPLDVAVIATGDELVPHDQTPGPGQIRNSNAPMLAAQIEAAGCRPRPLGIAPDDRDALGGLISTGLNSDVLLLSGGVSAGDYDFVPQQLAAAGVVKLFHKVAIKPGKPIWAGFRDRDGRRQFVFGLPGNPVSSFVCFEVFVRPVLAGLLGSVHRSQPRRAVLSQPHVQKGDRVTFWPAIVEGDAIRPLPWKGSADLVQLAAASALLIVPPGSRTWEPGEPMEYVAV